MSLRQKRQKVEAVDQSAVISICCVVMPAIDAADVDAPQVECAVKTEVSIPEDDKTFLSQQENADY